MLEVKLRRIAEKTADFYAGKNWYRLSKKEQDIVDLLVESGFLEKRISPNGYVGNLLRLTTR